MKREKAHILIIIMALVMVSLVSNREGCAETDAATSENKNQIIEDITPKEAHVLIEKNKNNPHLVILDVRTAEEFSDKHIENAINLDFKSETFEDDLDKLDKNKTYITHCRSGNRSARALDTMKNLGFKEAYNMTGGILEWEQEGYPTTR